MVVLPGHGQTTTIGRERATNPYLAGPGRARRRSAGRAPMSRPAALSGFPEWLPADRIVEQHVLDTVRRVFELHGFASIETRAVEPLEQMLRKGEIDKEVYVLRRLHAPADEPDAGLGLHFDLTVPLARYVLENAGHLEFPFRRYQIQKAWRGERPQEGRYREFTQADIDVIGRDTLAFHHEVEVALVMAEALPRAAVAAGVMQVNSRRLMEGFFLGVGATDPGAALRAIDKLDKVGPRRVVGCCRRGGAVAEGSPEVRDLAATAARTRPRRAGPRPRRRAPAARRGSRRAARGPRARPPSGSGRGRRRPEHRARPRLLHRHGLRDPLVGLEHLGSICSGGRYDALASDGRTTYPGVGISLGVSRLSRRCCAAACSRQPLGADLRAGRAAGRGDPRRVGRVAQRCARGASPPRSRRGPTYGKQIRYAERRGIPFVWFPHGGRTRSRTSAPASRSTPTRRVGPAGGGPAPPASDLAPPPTTHRVPAARREELS